MPAPAQPPRPILQPELETSRQTWPKHTGQTHCHSTLYTDPDQIPTKSQPLVCKIMCSMPKVADSWVLLCVSQRNIIGRPNFVNNSVFCGWGLVFVSDPTYVGCFFSEEVFGETGGDTRG